MITWSESHASLKLGDDHGDDEALAEATKTKKGDTLSRVKTNVLSLCFAVAMETSVSNALLRI